jgi:hypothetical protein
MAHFFFSALKPESRFGFLYCRNFLNLKIAKPVPV